MTSSDRFPVPVRSAVKSNSTSWCYQNLSKHALNALTVQVPYCSSLTRYRADDMHTPNAADLRPCADGSAVAQLRWPTGQLWRSYCAPRTAGTDRRIAASVDAPPPTAGA